ncbi:hypothetical protein SH2C18_18100 [Clostridium sediminicola]|uniref:hypothetical protein n=1 Tax=Clostridium sediminicola TaxID=3114879 RepID=UPI0031F276CE
MNENYETIDVNNEIEEEIQINDYPAENSSVDIKSDCAYGCEEDCDSDCCEGTFSDEFKKCEIKKEISKAVFLECQGRLLRLKLKLKRLCAGNFINLGVVILNMDDKIIGFRVKKFKIPGCPNTCVDICKEFCFAFEDENICQKRNFKVLVIAQYC